MFPTNAEASDQHAQAEAGCTLVLFPLFYVANQVDAMYSCLCCCYSAYFRLMPSDQGLS
jgi:hypothetical protein